MHMYGYLMYFRVLTQMKYTIAALFTGNIIPRRQHESQAGHVGSTCAGWMQQSLRMVVACFLTEYLNMHWVEGAAWFHDTLVSLRTPGWVAYCSR